ncbi:MAG TPA: hypothetical protein ENN69_08700, partial [Spirochaetia bacterium]|nr:hypothetical protein [Spirochaetia bacterium]
MATYSQNFIMTKLDDPDAELVLFLNAAQTGTVYIDNVVLVKINNTVAEKNYPTVTPTVDRSNLILYEISPGSYSRGVWDHGEGLKDITAQLDRLRDMGINCIWINPIFLGEGMGYWTYDYYRISYKVGNINDMKELVWEAHKRNMLVIIDLVINHVWDQSPLFQDVERNGTASPYANFYFWDGEPGASNALRIPWDPTLPEINLDDAGAKAYMFDMAAYWVQKLDIDGYRVDVAMRLEDRHPGVSLELRQRLEQVKPD